MSLIDTLRKAGFQGQGLKTAYAISQAESGGNARAFNPDRSTGDQSYGLFQINMLGAMGPERRARYGLASNEALYNPLTNAKVAYQLSKGGTDWSPWSTYKSGAYQQYLGKAPKPSAPLPPAPVVPPKQKAANLDISGILGQDPAKPLGSLDISDILFGGGRRQAKLPEIDSFDFHFGPVEQALAGPGVKPVDTSGPHQPVKDVRGRANVVSAVRSQIGVPYSWGGGTPKGPGLGFAQGSGIKGFDCSSLLQYGWAKSGVAIPRVTYDQWRVGRPVKDPRPGDAVFFNMGSRGPEHVGIYIGNGKFIEAPRTGLNVRVSDLSSRSDYVGARTFA